MNELSKYENVLHEVKCSLENLIKNALEKKISKKNIIIDPGIGFSKDLNQNLEILKNLDVFQELNLPILIGASRKRFIGEILNEINPKERDIGTLAVSCLCSYFNVDIVRVHNVKMNYQVLKVADKIYRN
jgi:dihydropteroate synthase